MQAPKVELQPLCFKQLSTTSHIMSEQLSFQPPPQAEDKPELSEEEQKALDIVNAQREKEEQAGEL